MTTVLTILAVWLAFNFAAAAALYLKPLSRRKPPKFVLLIVDRP